MMSADTQRLHGRLVELSSTDRVVFPDAGITKGEVVSYYDRIATTMTPYVQGRPVALKRYPEGLAEPGFFQKNASEHYPDWIERVAISRRDGGVTDNIVLSEAAVLAYLANQGMIELHSWLSGAAAPERHDQVVFDLDPPGEDVSAARGATRRVGAILDELGVASLLKTSGSKGYHVHVRIDPDEPADPASFASDVAELLVERFPDELTVEFRKRRRGARVLVDHFRNRPGQTVVAPYSLRARPTASIATPIAWDELSRVVPQQHTLRTIFRRLGQREDPWAARWDDLQALGPARARLDELRRR